jgi:uncharacterized protein (DUF2235 family)
VQDAAAAPSVTQVTAPGKRIVIFADGTGNAYSVQESNIWRLYNALDKGLKPDGLQQIARYIPGVGTSSNSIIRALDGATGFGVPSNVRKLYRFLCWNWREHDEIYLFGFSRGAFTVRALAGMISMQGLMPREVPDMTQPVDPLTGKHPLRRVGNAEMTLNAAGAWRAYRSETAPLFKDGKLKMNPLISLVRLVRDGIVWTKRKLMRQMQHAEVQEAQTEKIAPGKVKVAFMGLYDTVEAYGIPVKSLADLVNIAIWPFQFRNTRCSPIVQKVRHALALDDERLTFHPIRFDQRQRDDKSFGPETKEIWFAGMHSDVGGGYPDNAVALDPLVWMADEARAAGLSFDKGLIDRYRAGRYPQALIHDSRAGMASFYRYTPRYTDHDEADGKPPVLHSSAEAKMRHGANGYTPLILPEAFEMMDETGAVVPVAMTRDRDTHRIIGRIVQWRKATNLITVALVTALVVQLYRSLYGECVAAKGDWVDWCWLRAPFGLLVEIGWSWTDFFRDFWRSILILGGGVLVVHMVNQTLADRIKDHSRNLWVKHG